jgi:hypothetical protein
MGYSVGDCGGGGEVTLSTVPVLWVDGLFLLQHIDFHELLKMSLRALCRGSAWLTRSLLLLFLRLAQSVSPVSLSV